MYANDRYNNNEENENSRYHNYSRQNDNGNTIPYFNSNTNHAESIYSAFPTQTGNTYGSIHRKERSSINGDISIHKPDYKTNFEDKSNYIIKSTSIKKIKNLHLYNDTENNRKDDSSDLGPFLNIWSKLYRALFNQTNVSFILTLFILIFLFNQLEGMGESVVKTLRSTCAGMETAASGIGSASYYATQGTNALIQKTSEEIYTGMLKGLQISLKLVNFIIIFVIERYQKLLLCLIDAFVLLGKDLIEKYAGDVTNYLNTTVSFIQNNLDKQVAKVFTLIDKVENSKLVQGIGNIFGTDIELTGDDFNFDSVRNALYFELPHDLEDKILQFGDRIPTLDDYYELVEDTISYPFNKLNTYLEDTFEEIKNTSSSLKLPNSHPTALMSVDLCSNVRYNWVDKTIEGLKSGLVLSIGILVLLFFLVISFNFAQNVYNEWQLNRRIDQIGDLMKDYENQFYKDKDLNKRKTFKNDNDEHILDDENADNSNSNRFNQNESRLYAEHIVHAIKSPLIWQLSMKFSTLFKTKKSQNRARWFISYIYHPSSLICLFAGLCGLICIYIQISFINTVKDNQSIIIDQGNMGVSSMATTIVHAVDDASKPYINSVNFVLEEKEKVFNDKLFFWVNGTITTINDTIIKIEGIADNVLDRVFKDEDSTIQTSIRSIFENWIRCVLGGAVSSINETMIYVKEKAEINLPRISTEYLANVTQEDAEDLLNEAAYRIYTSINNNDTTIINDLDNNSTYHKRDINTSNNIDNNEIPEFKKQENKMTASDITSIEFEKLLNSYLEKVKAGRYIFFIMIGVGSIVPISGILCISYYMMKDYFVLLSKSKIFNKKSTEDNKPVSKNNKFEDNETTLNTLVEYSNSNSIDDISSPISATSPIPLLKNYNEKSYTDLYNHKTNKNNLIDEDDISLWVKQKQNQVNNNYNNNYGDIPKAGNYENTEELIEISSPLVLLNPTNVTEYNFKSNHLQRSLTINTNNYGNSPYSNDIERIKNDKLSRNPTTISRGGNKLFDDLGISKEEVLSRKTTIPSNSPTSNKSFKSINANDEFLNSNNNQQTMINNELNNTFNKFIGNNTMFGHTNRDRYKKSFRKVDDLL